MGYTATCHTEIKVAGKWLHWSRERPLRGYDFYKALGLHADKDDADKGVPDDATETTKLEFAWDGSEATSPNCLSREEVNALIGEHKGQEWLEYWEPPMCESGVEDARMIVWF